MRGRVSFTFLGLLTGALAFTLPAWAGTKVDLQHVKYDEMTHVQVRSGRIEAELYAQPVAAFEARPKVVFHVDLHRPLAQALEELATHGFGLGIDRPWTEVDLRVSRQQRLEQGEDRPVDRIDQLDHEERVAH